jgi:cell division protease FtsH
MGGGNDEREQTLNQLLVEMDGFEMKDNVIVIAATNRPDILDPALLRPGRFDRQVRVDVPDRPGRKQILEVHTKGKPLSRTVDLDKVAAQTSGFTGADLANLVNEGALLAARRGLKRIGMPELEEGIMRVIVGPEKKARLMSEREKRVTAVHEMGHAMLAHYLEHADPPHKISIVGRGMALGYVVSLPKEDRFTRRKVELMATLAQALGGRTAEEIVFGEFTTGAENDLQKVTQMAKRMVMKGGMSESLGARSFGGDSDNPFLGRDFHAEPDYSDGVAQEIDKEIQRIIQEAHDTARRVLEEHREELEKLADVLVAHENMDAEQFERLMAGEAPSDVFDEAVIAAAAKAESDAIEAEDAAAERRDEPKSPNKSQLRPGFSTE